jgi:hypothetical protein
MSLPKFLILAAVILLFSFGVFEALYVFDPANLREKSEPVTVVKNSEPVTVAKNIESTFIPENLRWTEAVLSAPWESRDSGEIFVFQNKIWLMGDQMVTIKF